MIDDAFKLTVDREFPNPLIYQKMKLENFMKNDHSSPQVFSHKASIGITGGSTTHKKKTPTKFADFAKKAHRSNKNKQNQQI